MRRSAHVLFLFGFAILHLVGAQDVGLISELPFAELLAQKKILEDRNLTEDVRPVASPLMAEPPKEEISFKGLSKLPRRKTFYEEDYDDEKDHVHKKKHEHKVHDVLNSSITVLSYLAFGGYLLCMIANAVREKRRRIMMAFPSAGPTMSNQFAQVLQHYATHRPVRPFIRFPTVTVHQGRRKRRRRSNQWEAPEGRSKKVPSL